MEKFELQNQDNSKLTSFSAFLDYHYFDARIKIHDLSIEYFRKRRAVDWVSDVPIPAGTFGELWV